MDTERNIQHKINDTFDALDSIKPVNVSPFFKEKTMNKLFSEKEEVQQADLWSWFTPKLQLAALVCVVVLNVIAFTRLEATATYEESVMEFAESYGLSPNDNDISILNN
ncbi:hypothetical protein [uncultured Algibacter sp.]|uniref:hypothetical protein n=1 Tax=uncultured Algibacter sp. TaxID=298659 RepID=UPI0026096217|nr:hypothetical protein [uncultured Algibacter sp.]